MTERLFSLSLVGAQFACVTLALWPFVEWHASAFGLALGSAGGALAIWTLAFNRLGNFNILPEVKSDARLITNGPYAYIRHPMYSALMLLVFGVAGLHANWVNVLAACALVAVLAVKSSVEEKRLEHAFEEYRDYASRVGRFVPRIRRRRPT